MDSYGAPGGWDHPQAIIQVCPDVKPRLTKEQHDILERHFTVQPKPSTSTKKTFADNLGVPLDKINNWFQNRRAKVKQDAKKHANATAYHSTRQHTLQFYANHSSLPSSGPEFFMPSAVVPSNRDPRDAAVSCGPSASADESTTMFSHPGDYTSRVPPIIETSQGGPGEGIEMNMRRAGYSLPKSVHAMASVSSGLCDYPPFSDSFPVQQFSGDFVDLFHGLNYPYINTAQDVHSPESLSASESPNNMPSLTSAYSHSWSDDSKLSLPADSPLAQLDPSDEPTTTWSPAQMMGQQHDFYPHQNPSVPSMSPRDQSEFASPIRLHLPAEEFGRRASSTSALTDSMDSVDIANQETAEPGDSFQTPPSSLAERRQKVRPANLGPAALRSASYTAGMPGSPVASHATPADQALRRIRSTGVGRISKLAASGQRSPLHFSFADAAAPPKYAHHVANYSVSTISSGPLSATTNSLAPPTPSTPSDLARFPHWQSQGAVKLYPSDSNTSVSINEESFHNGLLLNVSSPPGTPLDTYQYAQFRPHMYTREQVMYHDTPPQSAPAMQLTFAPTSMMQQSQALSQPMNGIKSHLRRPSLPDNNFSVESQQEWPPVPLFDNAGELAMSNPMVFNAHSIPQFAPPPINPSMHCYPMAIPESLVQSEFAVHHYSPPQGVSCSPSPPRNDTIPKSFHFSNTGPKDFQGSPATKS